MKYISDNPVAYSHVDPDIGIQSKCRLTRESERLEEAAFTSSYSESDSW